MKKKRSKPPTAIQRWNAWYRDSVTPARSMMNWSTAPQVPVFVIAALGALSRLLAAPIDRGLLPICSERLFRTEYLPIATAFPFGLISKMCL